MSNVPFPPQLQQQLVDFIDAQTQRCLTRVNDLESHQRVLTNLSWAREFAHLHYISRIQRAEDLESPEVEEAQKLARVYIGAGNHDYFVTCVDGRNMPAVMFSKPPHVGGVLRAPAGAVTGFMQGQEPESVYIDMTSYAVQRVMKLLREKANDTIFYGLDSHVACAARGQIHETEGGVQKDSGLRSDINSKLMTARGILQLRAQLQANGESVAEIIPTFFSFDPHSGGVIMGLEAHIDRPEIVKNGYTPEELDRLAEQGLIVRTLDVLASPRVQELLQNHLVGGTADFREQYGRALAENWRSITSLYANGSGELYQILLEKLTRAYSLSGWVIGKNDAFDRRAISERALQQKTKFLLKNVVTRFSIAGCDPKWPYDQHQEEMTVITDGGYAPFSAIDAFAVFSRDLNALLTNTKLTIDLIRSFRRGGKIHNPVTNIPMSQSDFIGAPVLISNKAIVKGIPESDWEQLSQLDLQSWLRHLDWDNATVLDWHKSNITEMIQHIAYQKSIQVELTSSLRFVDAVYELFDRMRIMLKDKYFRQMIFQGNIVILNTIVDHNRYPRLILGFSA